MNPEAFIIGGLENHLFRPTVPDHRDTVNQDLVVGKNHMHQPLVAISSDVREFDNYTWHAVPETYLNAAVKGAGVLPLIVPSFGTRLDLDGLLNGVDGLLLTGSKSNVHPELYGETPSSSHEPYDTARDSTTLPMIRAAIGRGLPLLAICRGLQELNIALNGTLATEIQERDGILDHRAAPADDQDTRFAIHQPIRVEPGSCLADILGDTTDVRVNSLHRQAVDTLAGNLVVEATAEDGTVEAVSVRGAKSFAVGVQWHPEYWFDSDPVSARIFQAFGDAARQHAAARLHPMAAE